jgi:hypothetical protein
MRTTLPASRIEAKTMGRPWADRDEWDVGLRGILAGSGRSWRRARLFAARVNNRFDEAGTIPSGEGYDGVLARPDAIS